MNGRPAFARVLVTGASRGLGAALAARVVELLYLPDDLVVDELTVYLIEGDY